MKEDIKLKAFAHCIIVEVEKVKEYSSGGIALSHEMIDADQMSKTEGHIISIGPTAFDFLDDKYHPKLGDKVYFKKYSGIAKKLDDHEYRIIHDEDIYAISSEKSEEKGEK